MSAITKTDKQRHIEGELRAKAAQEKLSAKLAVKRKEKLTAIQAEGKQNKKHACKHCDGTYFKHRIGAHMINNHAEELQRRLAPYKRIDMPTVPIRMLEGGWICLCCQDVWDIEARALSHIAKSNGVCSAENQIRKLYEFLQCPAPRGGEQKVRLVADKAKQLKEASEINNQNDILIAQNLELRSEMRRMKNQLTNRLEYTAYKYQMEYKILKERLAIAETFLQGADKKGDIMPIYRRAVDAVCLDEEELCRLEDLKSRCAEVPAEVVLAPAANTIELPPAPAPTVTEPEPTPAPELIVCEPAAAAAEPQPTPEPPAQPTQKRIKPKVPRRDLSGTISQPAPAPEKPAPAPAEKPAPAPAEKPATPPSTPPAHDKCAMCRVATGYGDDTLIACGGCGQNTHAQNDLVGCYQMDCETCHKSICLICVKKAGGNKMHPYCSRACNTRLDN
jgi:hypothetical protein